MLSDGVNELKINDTALSGIWLKFEELKSLKSLMV